MIRVTPLAEDQLEPARALLPEAFRAVAEEKLFGPCPPPERGVALAAAVDGRLVGVAVVAGRWLRLLAVGAEDRGRGAGSALLEAASARARAAGSTRLRTGDQPGNYLTPGIDARQERTIAWLERRGFRRVAENENMVVPWADLPEAPAAPAGYTLRRARRDEGEALARWIEPRFSAAWAFEATRALEGDPPGVHLARAGDETVAFACHDGNNRGLGWFGPAGTAEAHRGRGLGQALLHACLRDARAAGHAEGVIAWIGPRDFYAKAAGARPGPRFVVLEKAL